MITQYKIIGEIYGRTGAWFMKVMRTMGPAGIMTDIRGAAPLYDIKDFGNALDYPMKDIICGFNDKRVVKITIEVCDPIK